VVGGTVGTSISSGIGQERRWDRSWIVWKLRCDGEEGEGTVGGQAWGMGEGSDTVAGAALKTATMEGMSVLLDISVEGTASSLSSSNEAAGNDSSV